MPDTGLRHVSSIAPDGTIVKVKGNRVYRLASGTWLEEVALPLYTFRGLDARGRSIWGKAAPFSTNFAMLRRTSATGTTSLVTPLSLGRIEGIVAVGDTTWFDVTEKRLGTCGKSISPQPVRRLHLRGVGDDSVLVEVPAPPALPYGTASPRFEMARDGTPIAVRGGWYARRVGVVRLDGVGVP